MTKNKTARQIQAEIAEIDPVASFRGISIFARKAVRPGQSLAINTKNFVIKKGEALKMAERKLEVGDTVRVVKKVDVSFWMEDMTASIGKTFKVQAVQDGQSVRVVISNDYCYPASALQLVRKGGKRK